MLLLFGGAHRMGSHFQYLAVTGGLDQQGVRYEVLDPAVFNLIDQRRMSRLLAACDAEPDRIFVAKTHIAFAPQIDCVLAARHITVFQIWRDFREALVSDYHYSQKAAGFRFQNFESYYRKRGAKILLRNWIQYLNWQAVSDGRVVQCAYEDLALKFDDTVRALCRAAGLEALDTQALAREISLDALRRRFGAPGQDFFRAGSLDEYRRLHESDAVERDIARILATREVPALVDRYERLDRWKILFAAAEYDTRALRRRLYLALEARGVVNWLRRIAYRLRRLRVD